MKLAGGLVLLLSLAASATATPRFAPHAYVPIEPTNVAAADVPRVLWLNRCAGGCTVRPGPNSARDHTSTIPEGGASEFTIAEWQYGDVEWQKLVTCVQEVYSPYDIRVTDVKPLETYNEAIVAGSPNQIGRGGIGGIAPGGCDPYNDVISFSFANIYGGDIFEICATVAQETGHAYGMDHEYEYLDGRSACTDPMTYRQDCGGQQFFRNEFARCGEFAARDCLCGNSTQNSHLILSSRLGPGTPITAPPVVAYTSPAAGTSVTTATKIIATASAQRGIKRVELWINGYKWSEVPGIEWGPDGQPASAYQLTIPGVVPDGVLDLQVIAKDDIDVATATAVVRVTKGAACTTADTCLLGQRCDGEGRCLWDPPTGEFGDVCTYEQFCKNGLCTGTADEKICTNNCVPGSAGSCPAGYDCLQLQPGEAVCFPGVETSGCCSTNNGAAVQTGLLGVALAIVLRRRRRRA